MKTREEAESVLLSRGWLTHMPQHFQQEVLRRCGIREYEPKERVYNQGEEQGGMFGLVSGSLAVSLAPNLRGPYVANFVRPGDWIGETPAIMEVPRQVSASARTHTVLAHLPLQAIREITASSPVFWRYLAVNVSLNLKIALQRYDELLIADPRARVAAVLLRLAGYDSDPDDPAVNPDIRMTQSEIGEVTRLTRNGLAGILSRLAAEGFITMGYGHITVANPAALIRIVKESL